MEPDHPRITLDHCVVHVSDWTHSNAFYRQVLGAEVVPVGAGFAHRFGNAQLNLHGPGLTPTPVARLPVPPGGSDLCYAWPKTVAEAQAHLERCGVAGSAVSTTWAGREWQAASVSWSP